MQLTLGMALMRTVPPQKIRIIEDNRQVSSVIGPYDEGGQLSLNCIVSGGKHWMLIIVLVRFDQLMVPFFYSAIDQTRLNRI